MTTYPIQLEISGPTALWTRPDTGSSSVSYVAPTFSAAKGIFESVLRWKTVNVRPIRCELCTPVQFHRYATNYGGPRRAGDLVAKGASGPSFQLFAVVLVDVCYRLYAEVEWNRGPHGEWIESAEGTCDPHAYQSTFQRRLESGRWFYQPCLGWKEFVPDYVGPFRSRTLVCETENHDMPTMLHMVFDRPQNGQCKPSFSRNLKVDQGVLTYAQ